MSSNSSQMKTVDLRKQVLQREQDKSSDIELSWIGFLTSQLTIFQSYMWRHIDVQADWRRRWTYGRAPNAIDIS